MAKTLNKLQKWSRRLRLGKAFKHQYQCHPNFSIERLENEVQIFWKKHLIAELHTFQSLQNRFSDSCFIVATGPSLGEINLSKLSGIDTISLNCAIQKFSTSSLSPTHCVIVDHRIFEHHWEDVVASIKSGANCYFSAVGLSRIAETQADLLKRGNIFLVDSFDKQFAKPRLSETELLSKFSSKKVFVDNKLSLQHPSIGFCAEPALGFFPGKTVATWACQIAYCLGYKNSFILGMDLGGTGKTHFYGQSNNKAPDFLADYEPYIKSSFIQAQIAANKLSFNIYNLSRHSTLPNTIIPKINFHHALSLINNKASK